MLLPALLALYPECIVAVANNISQTWLLRESMAFIVSAVIDIEISIQSKIQLSSLHINQYLLNCDSCENIVEFSEGFWSRIFRLQDAQRISCENEASFGKEDERR